MHIVGAPVTTELLTPDNEQKDTNPEISIVVPALNEQITIGEFIDWCWLGLKESGLSGEVVIVDSSSDSTPNIALAKGARVVRTPKRGLGQAYLDAVPYIRGHFIIMGDCDLTYDFREIKHFTKEYKNGAEYVMGSRFKGSIEPGAMPILHQYFGTPLTTWILNKIYHSNFTDIHCGMRGVTRSGFEKIDLTSTGWEYASEMVLKASRLNMKIKEVPVKFYKDREGRYSHHRRLGFWSPWHAGWINLKVMIVFSPDSFLIKPGICTSILGILIIAISYSENIRIGSLGFDLHTLLLGTTLTVLGYSLLQGGIIARSIHGLRKGIEAKFFSYLTYDTGMFLSGILGTIGLSLDGYFLYTFYSTGFVITNYSTSAVIGLLALVLSTQTFALTILLEMIRRTSSSTKRKNRTLS